MAVEFLTFSYKEECRYRFGCLENGINFLLISNILKVRDSYYCLDKAKIKRKLDFLVNDCIYKFSWLNFMELA